MKTISEAPFKSSVSTSEGMQALKILVTGGTGFLGSAVVRTLSREGNRPIVFRRANSSTRWIEGCDRREIIGSLEQLEDLRGVLEDSDIVIHCAAVTPKGGRISEDTFKVNLEATRTLARLCRVSGRPRFIFVSSAGTMGPLPGTVSDERAPFTMKSDPYFLSKHQAEEMVLEECRQGLDALIVNPTTMIGPLGLSPRHQALIRQAATKKMCLVLPGGSCFVGVEDVAQGILLAARRGRSGERYILGGENLSFADYARTILSLTGNPARIIRIPRLIFRALGRLAAGTSTVTLFSSSAFYSSRKAASEFGYRWTPLERVLQETIPAYIPMRTA